MTRSTSRPLALVAALLVAATLASACSDATGPEHGLGRYRLATVNGQPVPYFAPTWAGYFVVVSHGDLYVRGDGTFTLGMSEMGLGTLWAGTWRRESGSLRLTFPAVEPGVPGFELAAGVDADSVVLSTASSFWNPTSMRFVFRLAPHALLPVGSGIYVLTSINGRDDMAKEMVLGENRMIHRVLFDSITVLDGVFFRRHRAERDVTYWTPTDSVHGETEWVTHGSYDGSAGMLVLRHYGMGAPGRAADSLFVGQGTLVRRTPMLHPGTGEQYVSEEVYSRR